MSCGVGRRRSSDPALLWLWHRPEATAPIRPLAWEPPYATGMVLKKTNTQLQLLAYTTATATWDPNHICKLHHSSQQRQILNLLSKAGDRTCNLMAPSRVRFCCTKTRTLQNLIIVLSWSRIFSLSACADRTSL